MTGRYSMHSYADEAGMAMLQIMREFDLYAVRP